MKHADFSIGMAFETSTGQRWRCTDVGRRTITAIELAPDLDLAWFNGPPYSVSEVVFDEVDIARAFRSQEEAIRDALAEAKNAVHPGYPHEVVQERLSACNGEASPRTTLALLRGMRADLGCRWPATGILLELSESYRATCLPDWRRGARLTLPNTPVHAGGARDCL